MPELPEVETIARKLEPELIGKTILDADLRWPRTLAMPSVKIFKQQIKGQKIREVTRRAKFFILHLSDFSLLIHLRMSGDLLIRNSTIRPEKHDRLILRLLSAPSSAQTAAEDGGLSSLVFNDTRKFGRVWLTSTPEEVLGRLGPEPLSREFTAQWLYNALGKRHRQLKPLLLDQTFLAGLGNIYTDEALHIAKLHPLVLSDSVTVEQARDLREAVRKVLKEGIRRNGASIDWVYRGGEFQNHFRVYDRAGKSCPVCSTEIKRIIVGQRSTHYCPKCQADAEVTHG
ncbi:MAG: bifunctional DNA-formamidopyrimidine glycosylase/DNA-(apurinic or apyrimidinic site) lyase [Anaerolineae bacterium]|nr:bifunctional DNA-formamidopyrimidine glycosylase/DNA-(apurinic or apyrimidinic site) lyase [Anaerolineae bacterium]MCI0611082.1 bifunctional DNA-formamidopyrimidine glycosylase/DNA-(apurinic or apyrimidinic site) lyase [Anaerolineae bacterium]